VRTHHQCVLCEVFVCAVPCYDVHCKDAQV
jgi:hypothetical protein